MELGDCLNKEVNAANGRRLCDFRMQVFYGNIVFFTDCFQLFHIIVAKEIVSGNVKRNGDPDRGRTVALKAADLLKHKQIGTVDQAVFFQDRAAVQTPDVSIASALPRRRSSRWNDCTAAGSTQKSVLQRLPSRKSE